MSAQDAPYLDHPLERGVPPPWASAWGDSKYGPWAAFEFGGVEQRLRWIFPGTFKMGSPETEPGRYDHEGPQHDVTISRGFWMAETPCTQALWEAVIGSNPSEFVDPLRPVENVSWDDAQDFLRSVEERQPGLGLRLPTEAQWEYACRAGTTDATYAGPIDIIGKNNAPVLDAIAWYGGNSGHEFDLDEGEDSSGWPEKHYEHTKAGTRRVKTRRRNPWGLYDTLGNVWEWCADHGGVYDSRHAIDPMGPDEGTNRVLRGGSWNSPARLVRAACRVRFDPSFRFPYCGFRLSRGHSAPSK